MNSVDDVVARGLCSGCGACAYVAADRYEMVETVDEGRRPRRIDGAAAGDGDALRACPGVGVEHTFDPLTPDLIRELRPGWGPVLEVWEGHATDDSIRYAGSSGGAASAIALACLERGDMHGVLHISARPDKPWLNQTVLSTDRWEILRATGSRYAPASPCEGLGLVEDAPGPCVFIGKPCDVVGLTKAQRIRSGLARNVGVTIAFFCAGAPSTRGTLDLLHRMGVQDPDEIVALRYRGHGWPGATAVTVRDGDGFRTRRMSYEASWGGILTNHKQWRCQVCADHTGELADVSVGDPWYRQSSPADAGQSLVLVRTERGRRVLREAIGAGYLDLKQVEPSVLPRSQPALLRGRGAVWGRSLACRLMGVPAPRYRGFPLFRWWWSELSLKQKVRTFGGTVRRVLRGEFSRERAGHTHESPAGPAARRGRRRGDGGLPVRATQGATRGGAEETERRKAA